MKLKYLYIIFIVLLLFPLVSSRQFTYIYPSPSEGEVILKDYVDINISLYEDYPVERCNLKIFYKNKSKTITMKSENHVCSARVIDLLNGTDYSVYVTTIDNLGSMDDSHNLSFSVNFNEKVCSLDGAIEIRGCIINWLEEAANSIMITIILICAVLIALNSFKSPRGHSGM